MIKRLILFGFYISTSAAMDASPDPAAQRSKDIKKLWKLKLVMGSFQKMSDEGFDKVVRGKIGNEKMPAHHANNLSPREIYINRYAQEIEKLEEKLKHGH